MSAWRKFLLVPLLFAVAVMQPNELRSAETNSVVNWQRGPVVVPLQQVATFHLPPGFVFADAENARKVLKKMGNPPSGKEAGILAPVSAEWFVVFEFSDTGYVRFTDPADFNTQLLFTGIRQENEKQNKARRESGGTELNIVSWQEKPNWDTNLNALVWAIRGETAKSAVLNYNVRFLGRSGVMEVSLVGPHRLSSTMTAFRELMRGFAFREGERYADFREGDRQAALSMAGIITPQADDSAVNADIAVTPKVKGPGKSRSRNWAEKGIFFGAGCVGTWVFAFVVRKRRRAAKTISYPAHKRVDLTSAPTAADGTQRRAKKIWYADKYYYALISRVTRNGL